VSQIQSRIVIVRPEPQLGEVSNPRAFVRRVSVGVRQVDNGLLQDCGPQTLGIDHWRGIVTHVYDDGGGLLQFLLQFGRKIEVLSAMCEKYERVEKYQKGQNRQRVRGNFLSLIGYRKKSQLVLKTSGTTGHLPSPFAESTR
jgi:hypothetical protein